MSVIALRKRGHKLIVMKNVDTLRSSLEKTKREQLPLSATVTLKGFTIQLEKL